MSPIFLFIHPSYSAEKNLDLLVDNKGMNEEKQRIFPNPDQETLIAFIYHTHRLERIPMNKKSIEQAISKTEPNHFVEGHLRAINRVLQLAPQYDLIPNKIDNVFEFDDKFDWIKKIHQNIMKPIADFGQMTLDGSYIHHTNVGVYRQIPKSITTETEFQITKVDMPDPIVIRKLLTEWAEDICQFHNKMNRIIDFGRYADEDVELLIDKAYEANLRISCIKPFTDGSNRLGRLVENLLRLNWGLPWKIISEDNKEDLLEDLRNMQKNY